MGLTKSDCNQIYYANCLRQGMSRAQIIETIHPMKRARFVADLNKSAIESHFGIKDHWFAIILIVTIITVAILATEYLK